MLSTVSDTSVPAVEQHDVALAEEDLAGDEPGGTLVFRGSGVPGASGAGWIGPCRVTSLVPSGKVASAWSSSISVSTPSITSEVSRTSRPADMISATDMPSRAASSTQAVSTATASGWLSSSPRSRRRSRHLRRVRRP